MSALTSLLVRDDAVSVRQIEEALARQVVDGGELDTALLELVALPENKLIAYRAASERAKPATREEVMSASSATRELVPGDLALALQISPLFHEGKTLTVAAVRTLKSSEIAQLSERTGMHIEYRITAELRVLAALERFYGHALLPRLAVLLNRVDAQPPGELVTVAPLQQSVTRGSIKTEQLPAFEEAEDFQAVLAAAFERASMTPHAGTPAVDPDETRPLSTKRAFELQRKRAGRPAEDTAKLGSGLVQAQPERSAVRPSTAPRAPDAPPVAAEAPPTAPLPARSRGPEQESSVSISPNVPRPSSPPAPRISALPATLSLTAAAAEQALASVEDRDAVMDIYFRFARQMFTATVLFTLKDGRVLGSQAHNIKLLSDIREVSLPSVRGSALEELTRTLLPRVMDLSKKDEDKPLVSSIRRMDAQPAALVPICIKRRVVAVLYGDRGGEPLHLDELGELLALMPHVTSAFERIIRARKALGLSGTPSSIGELSHAPTQRSMPAQSGFGSEARTAEMNEQAKHALEALKIPRTLPGARAFGFPEKTIGVPDKAFEDDGDIYATARIPIQPLPLDQFDSPPRYLSKPPPGTGRYQSLAPKHAGAEEVLRPPSAPGELREERTSGSRRPPPRSDAGPSAEARPRQSLPPAAPQRRPSNPPPGRRISAPPPAPTAARRSAPPQAHVAAPAHPSSLAAPKPAPGSGVYHSQIGSTELISMPHARKEEAFVVPATPSPEPSGGGFFLRSESRPPMHAPANHNDAAGPRVSSGPPPKTSRPAPAPPAAPDERTAKISQLIDELIRSEPGEDSPALKSLVAFGEPALSLLLARFPGPLWFDRRKPHARVPLGRDISPICRALDAFGDQAVERLIPVLGSNVTEVRYYGTLFAGDRVRPSLLDPMLARLFDDDPQIRLLVRDVLPHYRKFPGFTRATERLCDKARDENAPLYERLAALDAISVLRDAGCVSTLIDLIAHRDKQICVPAHRALTLITSQDFGKTPRKWRSWLNANEERHRVEWLIDGLMHSEEPMRATAGLELQKLTQVYYGYVAAASKREREAAQKRYAEWWRTEGRARFSS
jgi:hypothetical protein